MTWFPSVVTIITVKHGGVLGTPSLIREISIESMLRAALVGFLNHCRVTGRTPHDRDLDALIVTGEI